LKNNSISHDFRVFVVKKTAMAAMKRTGKTWIHNRSMGATCEKCNLTSKLKHLAEKAAKALDLDIAGVDLIPDSSVIEGFQVIEVNGVPAWRGIQSVSEFNVTRKMVDLLLEKQTFLS
jgi:glutathione synthase/RimK-type ligase-like ATP-grasp enzyme